MYEVDYYRQVENYEQGKTLQERNPKFWVEERGWTGRRVKRSVVLRDNLEIPWDVRDSVQAHRPRSKKAPLSENP